MKNAIFYHAGCPVCITAEQQFASAMNPTKYQVDVVHLGEEPKRISEAEAKGVKSVPAIVIEGIPFHINFGAAIEDLKQ